MIPRREDTDNELPIQDDLISGFSSVSCIFKLLRSSSCSESLRVHALFDLSCPRRDKKSSPITDVTSSITSLIGNRQGIGIRRKRGRNGTEWLMLLASLSSSATAAAQQAGSDGRTKFAWASVSLKSASWIRMVRVASDVASSNGVLLVLVLLIVLLCLWMWFGINGDCQGRCYIGFGSRHTRADSSSEERA